MIDARHQQRKIDRATGRRAYAAVLLLVGAGLVLCTAAALLGATIWGGPESALADRSRDPLARAWVHWDSGWYATIARDGYWYRPGAQSPVAFFPAYPVLIAIVASLGIDVFTAGILLGAAFGCGGLLLFNRWAARLRGEVVAFRATTLFVVYPFAYYLFGAMYSDALFLFAVVGAFFALEEDRLWLAVLLGALATAARPIAPAVVLGLVARRIELRAASGGPIRASDFAPALAGLGLGVYMAFLWREFGDPLAFVRVQSAPGWGSLEWPGSYLKLPLWEMVATRPTEASTLIRLFHGAIGLATLLLTRRVWRTVGRGYAVYVAIAIGIPLLSSKDFMGVGRYVIAAFPTFLAVATTRGAVSRAQWIVVALSALALLALTIAFAADQYVA